LLKQQHSGETEAKSQWESFKLLMKYTKREVFLVGAVNLLSLLPCVINVYLPFAQAQFLDLSARRGGAAGASSKSSDASEAIFSSVCTRFVLLSIASVIVEYGLV